MLHRQLGVGVSHPLHIDAIKPFVSRQVWALVQLQLLTGARAGELVGMRANLGQVGGAPGNMLATETIGQARMVSLESFVVTQLLQTATDVSCAIP